MTRLSAAPLGAWGITPAGVPVPASRVSGPTRWASLQPMIDRAEKSFGPSPNDQTILPAGSVSMTRLLNWSAIRMLPRLLKARLTPRLWAWTALASSRTPAAVTAAQKAPVKCLTPVFCGGGGLQLMSAWPVRLVLFPRDMPRDSLRMILSNIGFSSLDLIIWYHT